MNYDAAEYVLHELFLQYTVPIVIFDEKKKVIYPRNFVDFDTSLFEYYKPNKICFIEDSQKIQAIFDASIEGGEYFALLGPSYTREVNLSKYRYENITQASMMKDKNDGRVEFIKLTKLIYSILNNKIPPQEILLEQLFIEPERPFERIFQENLENRREKDLDSDSAELERRLIQSIISNDKEGFEWLFSKMDKVYFATLHSDRLTSLKYKYIGLVTIFTRVSINNGVNITKAYSLSDTLIQSLETITNIPECISYLRESCLQFMKLINMSKIDEQNVLVRDIKEYIVSHVNQKTTIDILSEHLNMSGSYLSSEFKKYTGITVHAYILKSKVEESKKLLVETDLEMSSISQKLGFSDQSHFNRIFKKEVKITPREFRKKYKSTKIL